MDIKQFELRYRLRSAINAMLPPVSRQQLHRQAERSSVSHGTLLRAFGPLSYRSLDVTEQHDKRQADYVLRQTAVIVAGMTLGLVRQGKNGMELVG